MTARGKIVLTLLVLAVVGVGAWKWFDKLNRSKAPGPGQPPSAASAPASPSATTTPATASAEPAKPVVLAETQTEIPKLAPPGVYQPNDNVVEIELSEYAGYAGLIVANGGLAPNDDSVFAKKHGFKLKITLSEEESWSALNSGKMAASATTADVLAAYGRQFQVLVPAQIGFSRGADGVVVRSDIKRSCEADQARSWFSAAWSTASARTMMRSMGKITPLWSFTKLAEWASNAATSSRPR